jgi:hypothetical protein
MGTVTQFTDDAYNKQLKGVDVHQGTLIGNWFEEGCQREGTGEGRTIPQRHVRRSGLLRDFTRLPSDGTRVCDDTFERLYGHRKYDVVSASSHEIGKKDGLCHLTAMQREPVQANLVYQQVGLRQEEVQKKFLEHAVEFVQAKEDAKDALNERRYFQTSSEEFAMPKASDVEKPAHPRTSMRKEIMCGPPLPDSTLYAQNGMDFDKETHFTLQEAITSHTAFASNPETVSSVKMTHASNGFRRNSAVSCPVETFIDGAEKDSSEPQPGSVKMPLRQPAVLPTGAVTLPAVKAAILSKFAEYGGRKIVVLRTALEDVAHDDATVSISDAAKIMSVDGMAPVAIEMFLKMMATMRKDRMQISKVMDSLRPAVPSERMKQIADLWESLQTSGKVDLGAWTSSIQGEFADMISADLGSEPGMVISKTSFYEYCADISGGMTDSNFAACIQALYP